MKKYLDWIRFFFLINIEYRAELLIWIGLSIIPNIILLLIWQSAYGNSKVLHGYNLSQILQYFLLGTLINSLTAVHFEAQRSREIREGRIDNAMTKPLSYPIQILLSDLGSRVFYQTLMIPIFIATYFVLANVFRLEPLQLSMFTLLQFSVLMIFAYLVEFSCAVGSVFLAFWFEGAEGLEHFKWIIITVFSGWMIPVAFMPQWLQHVVDWLPFRYMYAVPIDVIQHKASLQLQDLVFMSISLGLSFITLKLLWHKAVYQYSSAGG